MMADKSMIRKCFRHLTLLVIGGFLCVGFSSCTPWKKDLDKVYQAAQKGNKHAMFAVVMYFDDFNGVVPLDSFKRYQRVLIEDGNHEVISQASSDEFNEYAKSHPKMDSKKLMDKLADIGVKWDKIGIRYGDVESYADLGSYYHVEYLKGHQPKDSIESLECYQKAWENWHMSERIHRDMNAGIVPLIKGGVAYGWHVYQETEDKSFIPRLFNAGLLFSVYVMSGLLNLLFTSQWWLVLFTILVLTLILSFPMIAVSKLYTYSSVERNTMSLGIMLGLWNFLLMFVAYCNDNPNWVSNVGALWFPEASYGLQPYLCVIPNLLLLLLFVGNMIGAAWDTVKQGGGLAKGVWSAMGVGVIFAISYLMAGMAGLFYIFVVIVVILVKSLLSSVPAILGGAVNSTPSIFPSQEELNPKEKACTFCSWYEESSGTCGMHGKKERYGADAYCCPDYDGDKRN